jgi:hypothetical protein
MPKIYHYTTEAAAKSIMRLAKQGHLEFLLGSQEQSGHATGAYVSSVSPADIGNRPVSRFLGTTAFSGVCYVFELDVPEGYRDGSGHGRLIPIQGDRGSSGIALTMTKGRAYADPIGDSDDVLTKNDCMVVPISCLKATWKMDSGSGSNKAAERVAFDASKRNEVAWRD